LNYQATPASLLVVLGALVFYAMWLARLVKQKRQPTPPYAAPAFLAFAVFHLYFWLSPAKDGYLIGTYVPGVLASLAFFFGASVVTSGAMEMCGGELCINKNNSLYRIIEKLPIEFEGKSLCSISWLAALLLLFLPVLGSVLAVFAMAVSIVVCFFTGQNVFKYAGEIMQLKGWPLTECETTKGGWWKGPGFYLLLAAVLGLLVFGIYSLFTNAAFVGGLLLVLKWVLYLVGGFALACLISTGLLKYVLKDVDPVQPVDSKDDVARFKRSMAMEDFKEVGTIALSPLGVLILFFQVFRQRFCPKIRYVED
jgi:hypothetical protein